MDTETFENVALSLEQLGNDINYLKENNIVDLLTYNGDAISIELPLTMALKIVQTDPGFKGDTASGATKPAILETGLKISVPLFISEGEMVNVDTRSGEYLERADK